MLSTADLKPDPHAAALPEGRRGRLLAVALLLSLLAAFWAGVVVPLTEWYGARDDRVAQREAIARRMGEIAAELPALRRHAAETDAAVPIPLLAGSTDAVAGAALQQRLQQISNQTGANLASAEILPGEQLGAYRRVGVRLLITASWPVLVSLLDAVTAGTPPLLINDLQIQSARTGPNANEPGLNASMVVYGFRSGQGS